MLRLNKYRYNVEVPYTEDYEVLAESEAEAFDILLNDTFNKERVKFLGCKEAMPEFRNAEFIEGALCKY